MIHIDADGYYVCGSGGETPVEPQCPKKIQRVVVMVSCPVCVDDVVVQDALA